MRTEGLPPSGSVGPTQPQQQPANEIDIEYLKVLAHKCQDYVFGKETSMSGIYEASRNLFPAPSTNAQHAVTLPEGRIQEVVGIHQDLIQSSQKKLEKPLTLEQLKKEAKWIAGRMRDIAVLTKPPGGDWNTLIQKAEQGIKKADETIAALKQAIEEASEVLRQLEETLSKSSPEDLEANKKEINALARKANDRIAQCGADIKKAEKNKELHEINKKNYEAKRAEAIQLQSVFKGYARQFNEVTGLIEKLQKKVIPVAVSTTSTAKTEVRHASRANIKPSIMSLGVGGWIKAQLSNLKNRRLEALHAPLFKQYDSLFQQINQMRGPDRALTARQKLALVRIMRNNDIQEKFEDMGQTKSMKVAFHESINTLQRLRTQHLDLLRSNHKIPEYDATTSCHEAMETTETMIAVLNLHLMRFNEVLSKQEISDLNETVQILGSLQESCVPRNRQIVTDCAYPDVVLYDSSGKIDTSIPEGTVKRMLKNRELADQKSGVFRGFLGRQRSDLLQRTSWEGVKVDDQGVFKSGTLVLEVMPPNGKNISRIEIPVDFSGLGSLTREQTTKLFVALTSISTSKKDFDAAFNEAMEIHQPPGLTVDQIEQFKTISKQFLEDMVLGADKAIVLVGS